MTWNLNVPFTPAVKASGVSRAEPTLGAYRVRCKEATLKESRKYAGLSNISLVMEIIEGDFAGSVVYRTLVPPSPAHHDADKLKTFESFLKGALVSFGHDASQLAQINGSVTIGDQSFVGREGFVYYEPRPEGDRDAFPNVTMLSKEDYAAVKAGTLKPRLQNGGGDAPAAGGLNGGALGAVQGFVAQAPTQVAPPPTAAGNQGNAAMAALLG